MNTARSILDDIAEEMGWDCESELTLCLRYINNQNDNATFEDFLRQAADVEKQMDGNLVEGSLSVPECWADLITTDFPEDLEGIEGAKSRETVGDPKPYYDDVRRASDPLPHDYVAEMELCSGQSNYWATVQIIDNSNGNLIYQTVPYHEPMDQVNVVANDTEFVVDVSFDQ